MADGEADPALQRWRHQVCPMDLQTSKAGRQALETWKMHVFGVETIRLQPPLQYAGHCPWRFSVHAMSVQAGFFLAKAWWPSHLSLHTQVASRMEASLLPSFQRRPELWNRRWKPAAAAETAFCLGFHAQVGGVG